MRCLGELRRWRWRRRILVRVCGDARRGVLIKDDGFELGTGIRLLKERLGQFLTGQW